MLTALTGENYFFLFNLSTEMALFFFSFKYDIFSFLFVEQYENCRVTEH